jgi:hypothetical protein
MYVINNQCYHNFQIPTFGASKSIDLTVGPLYQLVQKFGICTNWYKCQISTFRVSSKHVKLLPYLIPSRFFETRKMKCVLFLFPLGKCSSSLERGKFTSKVQKITCGQLQGRDSVSGIEHTNLQG